jgi:hypothetical protein
VAALLGRFSNLAPIKPVFLFIGQIRIFCLLNVGDAQRLQVFDGYRADGNKVFKLAFFHGDTFLLVIGTIFPAHIE